MTWRPIARTATTAAMAKGKDETAVRDLIAGQPWRRRALEAVAALDLPDGWIGAGFVRAPVWD